MMDESEYESLPTENFRVHLIAGGFAGVMEHCAMYPIDFVKVLSSQPIETWGIDI